MLNYDSKNFHNNTSQRNISNFTLSFVKPLMMRRLLLDKIFLTYFYFRQIRKVFKSIFIKGVKGLKKIKGG